MGRLPFGAALAGFALWLGQTADDAAALLRPAADGALRLWPVSRAVNILRNNRAELLDLIDDPHAPPPSDAPAGPNPA